PDIVAFGKKAEVGGILANRAKIDRVGKNVLQESSRINSAFGGNLVDMIRFKRILEVIDIENLVEKANEMGKYLMQQIDNLIAEYPYLCNARGKVLLCAFDFDTVENRDTFINKTMENKLLILGCGEKSVRFRPHLTVTIEDIGKTFDIIRKSL